jgi:hypothetical protein
METKPPNETTALIEAQQHPTLENRAEKLDDGKHKDGDTPAELLRSQEVPCAVRPCSQPAQPGPRVPLAEAFRLAGLDEWAIAQDVAGLVDSLRGKDEPKLLLDVLKESSRCLENTKTGGLSIALVHNVPRPRRRKTEPATPVPNTDGPGEFE